MNTKRLFSIAWLVLLISALMLSFLACWPTSTTTTTSDVPTIVMFSASDNTITKEGDSTTLIWNVTNATSIQIDQNIGSGLAAGELPAAGTIAVSPASDTTYTLIASNSAGISKQPVTISVALLPDIVIFEISPNILHWSKYTVERAVMRWEVRHATTVKITSAWTKIPDNEYTGYSPHYGFGSYNFLVTPPGWGIRPEHSGSEIIKLSPETIKTPITGSISVGDWTNVPVGGEIISISKPVGTTTYTLEATNANGTVTKTQTLEAVP